MTNRHGDFVWYELMADDAPAAAVFYGDILGWQSADSGQKAVDYRILTARDSDTGEENAVGGILQLTAEMKQCSSRPLWVGYVAVEDVDTCVERVTQTGGGVMMSGTDISSVGRIAKVTDPQGASFCIMRGLSDEPSLAFAFDRPRIGHCAWNELSTTDPSAALPFYGELFGWTKDGEMPLGDMGAYEFLRHAGVFGAMMQKPVDMPVPIWVYYFRVPDIDVAVEKTVSRGGQVMFGPDEIPGGEFVIKALDPQGALFALIGRRQK